MLMTVWRHNKRSLTTCGALTVTQDIYCSWKHLLNTHFGQTLPVYLHFIVLFDHCYTKKVKCQNISNILRLESCVHFSSPFLASIPKMKRDRNIVSIAAFIFLYVLVWRHLLLLQSPVTIMMMVICLCCQCLRRHTELLSSECSQAERFIVTELTRAWTFTPGDRCKCGDNSSWTK